MERWISPAPPWRIRVGLKVGDADLLAIMSDARSVLGVCMSLRGFILKGIGLRMYAARDTWVRRGALGVACQCARLYISRRREPAVL